MSFTEQWRDERITFSCIYALVSIFGIIGNTIVCYVLGMKTRRKDSDVFIISLAVADLIVSVSSPIPLIVFPNYYGYINKTGNEFIVFHISNFLCKISGAVSAWTLVSIAIERSRAITQPFHARISKTMKGFMIIGTWFFSFITYMPIYLYIYKQFRISYKALVYYGVAWVCLAVFLPLIIISILYGICWISLRPGPLARLGSRRRLQENKRAVKMFLIIVISFFILTTPIAVLVQVIVFRGIKSFSELRRFEILTEVSLVLLLLNSCINPFIYAKMHKDVNAFIARLIARIFSRIRAIFALSQSSVRSIETVL